jgi:hypothetical protein
MYLVLCKNVFGALQKCIWCFAKMYLVLCKNVFGALQKCIFAKQRVHFSLENIQQHKLCKARTICGNCGKVLDDCAYVLLNKIYAP